MGQIRNGPIHTVIGRKYSSYDVLVPPIVAKVGGLQSQGVKGEVVVIYCEPLTKLDLESSGFPGG